MNKSITLNFTFRNYNKIKDSEEDHYLVLRLLPFGHQSKTGYSLPPKHWDKQAQQVKKRYWDQHPELVKTIRRYKDKFAKYYKLIQSGEIHPKNVCAEILSTKVELGKNISVIDFIKKEEGFGITKSTKDKHINRVKGVQKSLDKSNSKIGVLTVSMLKDRKFVQEIFRSLMDNRDLMDRTRNDYMSTLDLVTRRADFKKKHASPFRSNNLRIKEAMVAAKPKVGIEPRNFYQGISKIKTYKDLEAYLLWLYSLCLSGLDLVDIANIEESNLKGYKGETITHYHPFGDLIGTVVRYDKNDPLKKRLESRNYLAKQWYLVDLRKKSKTSIETVYNMFPTLFVRDWLVYVMHITSPDIVYRGKDRLRLFKVRTKDKKHNDLSNNKELIRNWQGPLTKKQNKIFGVSIQKTRHTITQAGKRFGYTKDQMDYQINHSLKGSINTYQEGEDAKDIREQRQFELISYFEVNKVLYHLKRRVMWLFKEGELIYYKKQRAIPSRKIGDKIYKSEHRPPFNIWNNEMVWGWELINHQISSEWTIELQKEYNLLKSKVSVPDWVDGPEALPIEKVLTPDDPNYPKRLIELEQIRRKVWGEFKFSLSESGGVALSPEQEKEKLQEIANNKAVEEIVKKG